MTIRAAQQQAGSRWGHVYGYATPGPQGEIETLSFGADGQPGGEGKNADLANWNIEKN
jgi:general secretion pathway protein G